MSISDRIPGQIEELLVTNRRGFLRSAGLLAVSFSGFAGAAPTFRKNDASSAITRRSSAAHLRHQLRNSSRGAVSLKLL